MTILKNTKKKIKGGKEAHIVPVRAINKLEYHLATKFQDLLRVIMQYADTRYPKRSDYLDFKKDVEPYRKYRFAKLVNEAVKRSDEELEKIDQAKKEAPQIRKGFSEKVKRLEKLFLDKKIDESLKMLPDIQTDTMSLNKAAQPEDEFVKIQNHFLISGLGLVFSGGKRSGPIQSFEKDDAEELVKKNLHEYKYTYLNIPKSQLDDYEYMIGFIQNLQKGAKPVKLDSSKFRIWKTYLYSENKQYQELEKLVDSYLYGNDKQALTQALKLLPKFPELTKATQKIAQQRKIAYRGVPLFDEKISTNEIKKKEPKYAACSWFESVAERFAQARGHLEAKPRSEKGAIITYKVPKEAALLDTSVSGGVFGESEILIDTSKAKLQDIEVRYWEMEEEEDRRGWEE